MLDIGQIRCLIGEWVEEVQDRGIEVVEKEGKRRRHPRIGFLMRIVIKAACMHA